mmetsp:Transcript_38297/g.46189  ORF Transcript_38297/g.46189 Transcript_38297/m.46189 type:complete len:487 (+) Transcript_38297:237-1697(+)
MAGKKPDLQINTNANIDLTASYNSLNVSDEGTLKLLSQSCGEYNINAEGLQKTGTPPNRKGSSQDYCYKIRASDIKEFNTIGQGACSTVKKAIDMRTHRFVALKVINVLDREKRHQLLNEVRTLCEAGDSAPALVSFYGAFYTHETKKISIVLEYMDGGSLANVIEKTGPLPEEMIAKVTARVLTGLVFLHNKRHMVHRDIKPGNILMNMQGEAKITDFGISAGLESTMALCHSFVGTMCYMSPERIANEPYNPSADIWSLGLSIMEAATKSYPYNVQNGPFHLSLQITQDPAPTLPATFSPEFQEFCKLCLDKDPTKRPTAEQLLQHPFVQRAHTDTVNLYEFMHKMFDPFERIESYAQMFTAHYYSLLDADTKHRRQLTTLYRDSSQMTILGELLVGKQAIAEKLDTHERDHPQYGQWVHILDKVHALPFMKNGLMIHVGGRLETSEKNEDGVALKIGINEMFVLTAGESAGEYFISNQIRQKY